MYESVKTREKEKDHIYKLSYTVENVCVCLCVINYKIYFLKYNINVYVHDM